jgi:protein PhnA
MEVTCPACHSENIYQDGSLWICPECSHEWSIHSATETSAAPEDEKIRDANGNELKDGDSVVVIKDLKIKGAASTIKSGTKIKSIRLSDGGDGHDVSCKIDGIGAIHLKSEFLRKSN